MNDLSDFEQYVLKRLDETINKLSELSDQVSALKAQAAIWGGLGGIVGLVACELIIKGIGK